MQLRSPKAKPDILVTGANGALGLKLMELLRPERAVAGTRRDNRDTESFGDFSVPCLSTS